MPNESSTFQIPNSSAPAPAAGASSDAEVYAEQSQISELIENLRLRKPSSSYPHLRTPEDKLNAESELGRTIFGPVPAGHQREFFEHKKLMWVWHESWRENDQDKTNTIRYEVRPAGVYKTTGGGNYISLRVPSSPTFASPLKPILSLSVLISIPNLPKAKLLVI